VVNGGDESAFLDERRKLSPSSTSGASSARCLRMLALSLASSRLSTPPHSRRLRPNFERKPTGFIPAALSSGHSTSTPASIISGMSTSQLPSVSRAT